MPANAHSLILACLALVALTSMVGFRMLFCRVREMRGRRIHPQAAATSVQMAARLEDVQAADNFRNLFEIPVLFYALVAVSLAISGQPCARAPARKCRIRLFRCARRQDSDRISRRLSRVAASIATCAPLALRIGGARKGSVPLPA